MYKQNNLEFKYINFYPIKTNYLNTDSKNKIFKNEININTL